MKKRFMLPVAVLLLVVALVSVPLCAYATDEATETEVTGTEAAPEGAHASEEVAPEGAMATVMASPIMPNLGEFIPMFLAVSTLVLVMSKFVWPPIMKALDAREEKIEGSLRTAEEAKLEAENILVQYQAKLEEGRKEAAALAEEGRKAGEAAKADIIARAETEASSIVEKAQLDASAKEKAAAAALQEKTAALAISIASKIIGEKLGPEDQAKAEKLVEIGG